MSLFSLLLAVSTFCNPLSLPEIPIGYVCRDLPNGSPLPTNTNSWRYVFWKRGAACRFDETRQFRETADPVVYVEGDRWYLYPSLGLLWTSDDCGGTWARVHERARGEYAPAVAKFRGKYCLCTSGGPLSVADAPTGPFRELGKFDLSSFGADPQMPATQDPALLADGDSLYLYWGCCAKPKALWGVELDPENPLKAKRPGSAVCLMEYDTAKYPWLNELIEGVWVFKRGDTYYLTYSTANTCGPKYRWCASKGSRPLGPFVPQKKNPFFSTEKGLVTGTGHGSIWKDAADRWWINSCTIVGAYHGFERLIAQDRLFFDADGDIIPRRASDTPQWLPGSGKEGPTGWQALPLGTTAAGAVDGRLATWSEIARETVFELDGPSTVESVRLIWRDLGLDVTRGVCPGPYRYRIDIRNGGAWRTWIDASDNATDLYVDYREGSEATAEAVRLTVIGAPKGLTPALTEFTVFGIPCPPTQRKGARVFSFEGFDRDAYVLLPSRAYDGNRIFESLPRQAYSPWYPADRFGAKRGYVTNAQPTLGPDLAGEIAGDGGDLPTPVAAVFLPKAKRAEFVFFEPQVDGKPVRFSFANGFFVVLDPRARTVRETAACPDLAAFYRRYFELRKRHFAGPRASEPSEERRRALVALVADRLAADKWKGGAPDHSVTWGSGWAGGPLDAIALAAADHPQAEAYARATLAFLPKVQTPYGFYWSGSRDGRRRPERGAHPETIDCHLTRRSADALFCALKLAEQYGLPAETEKSLRACADAYLAVFRTAGEIPSYVNPENGEPKLGGGTAGASAPAALALLAARLNEPKYLAAAEAIAENMWTRFASRGLFFGGAGDALDVPESESCAAYLESCVTLAEQTGKRLWVERAQMTAHVLSTWVVSFSFAFPPQSELARHRVNSVGSVVANVQNRHASPGFCISSGDALLRLTELTGDPLYRDLYEDVRAFMPQVVSTAEDPFVARLWTDSPKAMPPGGMNERVNLSNWEGENGRGEIFYGCCWCEAAFLLMK